MIDNEMWISVSDRLPPEGEVVEVELLDIADAERFEGRVIDYVTHWRSVEVKGESGRTETREGE